MKERISLSMSTIGLTVYGGECPQMHVICQDTVEKAFCRKRNLKCWAAVGAVPFTMQFLTYEKVHCNGNDENYPEYNKYQIIQSKNDYATLQLIVMGYNANLLKTEFNEEKIMANAAKSVTTIVENTQKRREALVKASTSGKKWFVAGGINSMADDPFIAAKMGNRALEIAKMNTEKKAQIAYHMKKDAAELVLICLEHELDNDTNKLCGKDLDTLLCWKGVIGKLPNIANKCTMYLELSTKGGKENILAWWTEAAKAELEALKNAPIKMSDTAYGRHEAQMKRDTKMAFKKMSAAKREAFLHEINEDTNKEDEPFPLINIEAV
jgi:hypothetical protein